MILESEPDVTVVGDAGDAETGLQLVLEHQPDVLLLDIRMPGTDGIQATRRLTSEVFADRRQAPAVLILTTFKDDDAVMEALRAGASGFVLKSAAPDVLVSAIRSLAAGDSWLDPAVTKPLIVQLARRPSVAMPRHSDVHDLLTNREREVLTHVANGYTNSQIAADLVISEATVKTHVGHIFFKLGLRDRAQAVAVAYSSGLVTPHPGTGRPVRPV